MGLMGWFSELVTGVNLDAEKERARQLDGVVAQQNRSALERGVWTEEQYRQAEANRIGNVTEADDYYNQVASDFAQGAVEGAERITTTTRKGINTLTGGVLTTAWRALPWWVWLLGIGYVAWQLGLTKRIFR